MILIYLAWCLSVSTLQLTTEASGDVTFSGHMARLVVLFILMHRWPAYTSCSLVRLGTEQSTLTVTVPSAQFTRTSPVCKQARSNYWQINIIPECTLFLYNVYVFLCIIGDLFSLLYKCFS